MNEMKLNLDEIEAEAERATPGPWKNTSASWVIKTPLGEEYYQSGATVEDAIFIAHARANIPALCALAREQAAEIERMHREIEEAIECLDNSGYFSAKNCLLRALEGSDA